MEYTKSQELNAVRNLSGSTAVEAALGTGAVVLTILALANIDPFMFASIAAIAVGASFLVQGMAISADYSMLLSEVTKNQRDAISLAGDLSAEFIGGIAGIVLGILSLINISPETLLPVAAIVFGGILFLGAGTTTSLSKMQIKMNSEVNEELQEFAGKALRGSSGAQILVGLGSITLGIIAIVSIAVNPLLLSLIAILSVGAIEFTKGSLLSTKMMNLFNRNR